MSSELKQNLSAKQTWLRGLYILIFAVIYSIAEIVLWFVVLFQFVATLFSGKTNDRLLNFGAQLSTFIYQILQYVTYNSEERPFPFAPWPDVKSTAGETPELHNER